MVAQALALFEETRKVESTGGMMVSLWFLLTCLELASKDLFQTENGQRRRTPGGVFISLFKLDSEIPEDVKVRDTLP